VMYLGGTLAAIAAEKAGLIKPGVPVVSAPQAAEAQSVIEQIASQRGSPLTLVGRDWVLESIRASSEGQEFSAYPAAGERPGTSYELALLGQHQQVNAATALATIDQLRRAGVRIPDEAVRDGLQSAHWPGRLEVLGRRPWVIVDGAHNVDSMQKLYAAIAQLFSFDRLILIFGASADKDIDGMLDTILPHTDLVLVTQARHPRAADPQSVVESIRRRGKQAQAVTVDRVLDEALAAAAADDLICATGSLFVVAALRAAWFRHSGQPLSFSDPE
jgi:dihydrofolate synthase/folylpolyglutamate synthase